MNPNAFPFWTVWCDYDAPGEIAAKLAWIGRAGNPEAARALFAECFPGPFRATCVIEKGIVLGRVTQLLFSEGVLGALVSHQLRGKNLAVSASLVQ